MKSVMVSIRPKWCGLIASGQKTVEVRKTAPKEVPFKAYIYCTKDNKEHFICSGGDDMPFDVGNGMVIGEFFCYGIDVICPDNFVVREDAERALEGSCISVDEFKKYMKYVTGTSIYMLKDAYAWHISDLVIYDKPKELIDFYKPCNGDCFGNCKYYRGKEEDCDKQKMTRPPQSWMYVEVEG